MALSARNSTWTYREELARAVTPSTRWIDLGCGHQLLPDWMADGESTSRHLGQSAKLVIGVDRVLEALGRHTSIWRRVAADVDRLPFGPRAFDLVTANMVVEHVEHPGHLLEEICRVLVPGGRFLLHTPNRNYYQVLASLLAPAVIRRLAASRIEGRALDDMFPTYYRMNTRRALTALAHRHGFVVERVRLVNSSLTFGRFGVVASLEGLVTQVLETEAFEWGRSNVIALLRRDR